MNIFILHGSHFLSYYIHAWLFVLYMHTCANISCSTKAVMDYFKNAKNSWCESFKGLYHPEFRY